MPNVYIALGDTVDAGCVVAKFSMARDWSKVPEHGPRAGQQAEAIVRTGKTWPQATKRKTGD